jgi:hypothetical protein
MRDDGHAAVELALAVATLLLPVALVVLSFGPWSERRVLAEAAAAESARAVVLELDHSAGNEVVTRMTTAFGLDGTQVRVGWCDSAPSGGGDVSGSCPLIRGSVVESTVQVWTPLVTTPWGPVGGLWVTGEHSEPIDLYRSLP